MVPAGYMAKRVVARPDWLLAERVSSIYSVSGCMSHDFADYVEFWQHNGYWLFDSPDIIIDVARIKNIDVAETVLFFYEVYELQFDSGQWTRFEPEPSFGTNISVPDGRRRDGHRQPTNPLTLDSRSAGSYATPFAKTISTLSISPMS